MQPGGQSAPMGGVHRPGSGSGGGALSNAGQMMMSSKHTLGAQQSPGPNMGNNLLNQ